jgi:hypothetical protein
MSAIKGPKKEYGHRVRLQTYVTADMYEAIRRLNQDAVEPKWESRFLRRLVADYLARHRTSGRSFALPVVDL